MTSLTFARHIITDIVISNNWPQYARSEFESFTESWECQHVIYSLGHAQFNEPVQRTA